MIFFVISGFIMMYVCSDEPPLVFLRRRILRVVPLYWIMTPVYFAALFRDDLAAARCRPRRRGRRSGRRP